MKSNTQTNMKRLLLITFLLSAFVIIHNIALGQRKIGGVSIPESFTAGKDKLVLNGAGIREKYFIDLYVGGLYLKEKTSDASKILDANEPMAVKMHIISGMITNKKMEETVREGFKKSTGGNIAPYKEKIDQMIAAFKEEIKVGDIFDIVYTPAEGTSIYKNNVLKSQVKGLDFKKVMFGIWLGKDPADDDLKDDMLNK